MLDSELLKNNLNKYKFIVIDCETEGLNLIKSKPWELAWDVYEGNKMVESHQFYLKWPHLNVSEGAAKATKFNPRIIEEKGQNPKDVIDFFNTYLYNKEYTIIGHNVIGYDSYILNVSMLQLGYKTDYSYLSRTYDTLPLARAYRLGVKSPENKEDMLSWQYSLLQVFQKGLKCKNSELAKEFGMEIDDSLLHGASFDIKLTAFSFFNLIKKVDIQ